MQKKNTQQRKNNICFFIISKVLTTLKTSIAIPDSALIDESTQLNKSRKISIIARACAIFQVEEIFIYHERHGDNKDAKLLSIILKYLETPQYFRKYLYPKMDLLKYAGVLQPLKIPSHSKISNPKFIKSGDVREGLVVSIKGKKFLDLGFNQLLPYFKNEKVGTRITIQFKEGYPKLSIKEISKNDLQEYWGYKVKERGNLFSLLSSWKGNIVLTSRKGKVISSSQIKSLNNQKPLLVVFGSPERGIHDILGSDIKKIQNYTILNFFPNQATETIRLEESILGSLAILNLNQTGYI